MDLHRAVRKIDVQIHINHPCSISMGKQIYLALRKTKDCSKWLAHAASMGSIACYRKSTEEMGELTTLACDMK